MNSDRMALRRYVGGQLREMRLERRLSQEVIGKAIGAATNTISRWETGAYQPKLNDLDDLARFFEVPIAAFFPSRDAEMKDPVASLLGIAIGLSLADLEEVEQYARYRRYRNL